MSKCPAAVEPICNAPIFSLESIGWTGQQYQQGQPVYSDRNTTLTGLFPDGTPFTGTQDKKPHYVYVWKTWGKENLMFHFAAVCYSDKCHKYVFVHKN